MFYESLSADKQNSVRNVLGVDKLAPIIVEIFVIITKKMIKKIGAKQAF